MLSFVQIANGEGLLWLIIIIASIAGQIAKASKRNQQRRQSDEGMPPPPEQGLGKTQPVSPEEELREFLRQLTGQRTPATPKPAAAPPPATPRRPKAKAHVRKPMKSRAGRRTTPIAPVRPAQPVAVPQYAKPHPIPARIAAMPITRKPAPTQAQRLDNIARLGTLRAAVLWREILGPPVALRR